MEKYYLKLIDSIYYAACTITLPGTTIKRELLFRDLNDDVLPLGKDKEHAEWYVNELNKLQL